MFVRQDRTDDVIEVQLYLSQVSSDSFRRYTLVVENAVAKRTHDVRFLRSKHLYSWTFSLEAYRYLQRWH